ncbi:MAG TPA: hypothetical protein VGD17_19145 [Chitinophagaceae bacterium]
MKNWPFLLSIFLFIQKSQAQTSAPEIPKFKLRCREVTLTTPKPTDSLKLKFTHISVRDERSDTSKLGLFKSALDPEKYKYCLDQGANSQLTTFVNAFFAPNVDPSSGQHIVMCIRKLWIFADDTTVKLNAMNSPITRTWLRSEFYLFRDPYYYPLYRFDSVLTEEGRPRLNSIKLVEKVLVASLQRLKQIDYQTIPGARQITSEQLNNYYSQFNAYPILQAATIGKGVFESFMDFRNNRVSDTNFEVRFESMSDILYVKDQNGQFYVKRNVWGFSNGENVFIRFGNNFFPLYRHHNTWEFFGSDKLTESYFGNMFAPSPSRGTVGAPYSDVRLPKLKLAKLQLYQLDMETGDLIY